MPGFHRARRYLGTTILSYFYDDFLETIYSCVNDKNISDIVTNCTESGEICCFVVDSTYIVSTKGLTILNDKLLSSHNAMADYLLNNRLKLKDDKTPF